MTQLWRMHLITKGVDPRRFCIDGKIVGVGWTIDYDGTVDWPTYPVIVGVQDEDEVERLLMAYSPHLRAILERSRRQFREGQWLSEEEFWAQFEPGQPTKAMAKPKHWRSASRRA
jgi:hypothetical protein